MESLEEQMKSPKSIASCEPSQFEGPVSHDQPFQPPNESDVVEPSVATLLTAKDPFIGLLLNDKIEILEWIGSGGFGKVYKGYHRGFSCAVAVKFLDWQSSADIRRLRRFDAEAKVCSRLSHQNLVTYYDYGVEPSPFIVMEYLQGRTLAQAIGGN